MSLNLHDIVRGVVTSVLDDEDVYLVQSIRQESDWGRVTAKYVPAELVKAQVQTLSGDDLTVNAETERTERDRKFYLYSDTASGQTPAGNVRILGRTGDFLYRKQTGTWWLVYNVTEDFTSAGWVCILASEQQEVPPEVLAAMPEEETND